MTTPSIFTFFSGIRLTNDQHAVLADFQKFMADENKQVFILRGYAGTGKTTILSGIVKYADALERAVRCCTPTGAASKVLSNKTGLAAKTLHGNIYRQTRSQYDEDLQLFQTSFDINPISPTDGTLFIVDEASMIGERGSQEGAAAFQFGSGSVLSDLFTYLNLPNNKATKVMFVGDPAQLPPVGSSRSVALEAAYLAQQFGVQCMEGMLTEVVRYDNSILSTATKLRKAIDSGFYSDFSPVLGSEVRTVQSFRLTDAYFDAVSGLADTAHNVGLFVANSSVAKFNAQVRSQLLHDDSQVQEGERLLVYANNYAAPYCPLYNGEMLVISAVHGTKTRQVAIRTKYAVKPSVWVRPTTTYSAEVTLNFLELSVVNFDGVEQRVQVLVDFLTFEGASLPQEVHQALAADLGIRVKRLGMSKSDASKAFCEAAATDPFFNVLQAKFGYGMTCHKAQGGEWRNVFVNAWTPDTMHDSERYRWLYTAYSRASQQLVVELPRTVAPRRYSRY
jgi:ATP-dependent exoDNAse (exonuclease V) alpha subunit